MQTEKQPTVQLRNDFYRDGFYKVLLAFALAISAFIFLVAMSVYLYITKPDPVGFVTDTEWRILPPVALDKPYLSVPDLLQWVSDALPAIFTYDFINYSKQSQSAQKYFTADGFAKYTDIINNYANYSTIQTTKSFVNASASGAPIVLNQGLLQGRYAWWVQMPIDIHYSSNTQTIIQTIILQVLVVRIPTLNNLDGVSIDNIIVLKGK